MGGLQKIGAEMRTSRIGLNSRNKMIRHKQQFHQIEANWRPIQFGDPTPHRQPMAPNRPIAWGSCQQERSRPRIIATQERCLPATMHRRFPVASTSCRSTEFHTRASHRPVPSANLVFNSQHVHLKDCVFLIPCRNGRIRGHKKIFRASGFFCCNPADAGYTNGPDWGDWVV
jgi:hypothetical protein